MLAASKKAHREKRRKNREKSAFSATVKPLILSVAVTAAIGTLLLLCASALLLKTGDPARYQAPVSLTVLYLTAFLGGACVTRMTGRRAPLFYGAALGALMLLLTGVLALALPREWGQAHAAGWTLLMRLLLLPSCILGALLASRRKEKRRRKR